MIGLAPFGVQQKKDPGGSPFTAGSANNGLSVDSVTGKIVAGNDQGDATMPARWLSNREIADQGFAASIIDGTPATVQLAYGSSFVQLAELVNFGTIDMRVLGGIMQLILRSLTPGGASVFGVVDSAGTTIALQTNAGDPFVQLINALQGFGIQLTMNNLAIKNAAGAGNGLEIDPVANDVKSTGTFTSDQPSVNGAGAWKLGKFLAGAVAPDAANYVEVLIDGVVRKLIVAV